MRVGEKGWLLDALAERMCFCSKVFFVFEGRLEVAVLLLDNNNQHAATKTAVEHICSLDSPKPPSLVSIMLILNSARPIL